MTTLPQTTPVRLPQSGHGVPAAPAHQTVSVPGGTGFHMTGADVWRVIRNNMWLIILFIILAGGAGYGANMLLAKYYSWYTATGLVQIRTSRVLDVSREGGQYQLNSTDVVNEQRTQAQLLKADPLISAVIRRDEVRDTDTFKPFLERQADGTMQLNPKLARQYFLEHFSVSPVVDSKLLTVSVEAPKAEDARKIVEAIVEEHLNYAKLEGERRTREETDALKRIRDEANQLWRQANDKVMKKQEEIAARGGGTSSIGERETTLRALIESQVKAKDELSRAKSIADLAVKTNGGPELEKMVESSPALANLEAQISNAQIALDTQRNTYGDESKQVQSAQALLDNLQKQADALHIKLRSQYIGGFLNEVKVRAEQAQNAVDAIDVQVKAVQQDMHDIAREMGTLQNLQDSERGLRELWYQADAKYRDVMNTTSAQNQSVIEWASHPETPEQPTFPRLKMTMAMAIFIGLCLALGIAFLRELMDDTVRRTSDIQRVGQMNILGVIADEADDPQVAGAQLAIFDAPHSLTAEQFRQLRTRLQHTASLDTTRSIMVTGPGPEDGKTTVAANLAAGLALNGRKILLVDANFRRPELHRVFGIGNERGLSDVLNGAAALEDVAVASRIPNLTVLPSGPKPVNATELFESQLLIDFIDRALEEYDHVIFDTGPFLVVSEAAAMAPRVDGVVTVVRAHAESRGLLQRMRDSLRQVKAEHLGVVLNAVRAQGGGYYRRNIKAYYDYQSAA